MSDSKTLSTDQRDELLRILEARFTTNMQRHFGLEWDTVLARLEAHPQKLWSLNEMERTAGEPDVVGQDAQTGEVLFYDCAEQSPDERRSLCYDDAALEARKANKPRGSAVGMANAMGVDLLDVEQYRALQKLGDFDTKTSSWLKTPADIRKLGGSIFGDKRYNTVFVYHNGAESYYGSRGFRCVLRV